MNKAQWLWMQASVALVAAAAAAMTLSGSRKALNGDGALPHSP
jgi:hypothetical protein